MAESSGNNLNYGHFGTPVYDLDTNEWNFARQAQKTDLRYLGAWEEVIPPSTRFLASEPARTRNDVRSAVDALVHEHPHLAPAAEYLPELALVSSAIISAANAYDPAIGDLLSFGSITGSGHRINLPTRVAALPAGEAGNILCLVILRRERHGWEENKNVWLDAPSMTSAECGYWNKEAVSIQQVCFAQTEEWSSLLAVRLPTKTVVLSPTLHIERRAAASSDYYHLPPSSIDARPIVRVTLDDTGGMPHADVSFNPDYQRQFAVVDRKGLWSVWDIERTRGNSSVSCSAHGSIGSLDGETEEVAQEDEDAKEDGWARILWVSDVNTIVVSNRRQLRVFSIKGGSTQLKCPKLISQRSAHWILDVKRHPKNQDQLFVLTSERLYLLAVTSQSGVPGSEEAGARTLLSWTHFRGLDDFTLQFCVHMVSDEERIECMMLLYSRLNNLVTVFQLRNDTPRPSLRFVSSDPTTLSLDSLDLLRESCHIRQLHLDSLQLSERESNKDRGIAGAYMDAEITFYQLSVMLSNLSIHRVMLYSKAGSLPSIVQPTTWSKLIPPHRIRKVEDEAKDIDDFVVPDGLPALSEPKLKIAEQAPRILKGRGVQASQDPKDYSFLYDILTHKGTTSELEDMAIVTDRVRDMLAQGSASVPLGTLMEVAGTNIKVSDVDDASCKLQELFSAVSHQDLIRLQRIASGPALRLDIDGQQEQPTISFLYDMILQNWIAPLPANIPFRVRQKKERLARRVAAEVMLASTRLRPLERLASQSESEMVPSEDTGVPSAAQPSNMGIDVVEDATSEHSSQALPLRPSFPLSSQLQSSSPVSEPPHTPTSNPLARLSKHLQIDKPLEISIPANVNQLLAHWRPGTDPNTYDWEATEHLFQPDEDEENTGAQREKARRKRERREKRQRREEELFRGRTTMGPPQFPRSSPGPMLGGIKGSQDIGLSSSSQIPASQNQGLGGFVIQSQVEPGRHGGRPLIKKKKKTRMSGF